MEIILLFHNEEDKMVEVEVTDTHLIDMVDVEVVEDVVMVDIEEDIIINEEDILVVEVEVVIEEVVVVHEVDVVVTEDEVINDIVMHPLVIIQIINELNMI